MTTLIPLLPCCLAFLFLTIGSAWAFRPLTDTPSTAKELAITLAHSSAPIEVTLVGVRRRARTANGLTVSEVPVNRV